MDLPTGLISAVERGRAVLFLGAGASIEATNESGQLAPSSQALAAAIASRFLRADYSSLPLTQIAELAESETSRAEVQAYIAELLSALRPSSAHLLLPHFVWSAIITTNFDTLVEDAYQRTGDRMQNVVPFIRNGQRVDERLSDPRSMPLYKLHGCISITDDSDLPLILGPDQYVKYRTNRSRLFYRVLDLAHEHTFVFIGHSLMDSDVRVLLDEIRQQVVDPSRFYLVAPQTMPEVGRMWSGRGFSVLDMTFGALMEALEIGIPQENRSLSLALRQLAPAEPDSSWYMLRGTPSESLRRVLGSALLLVHKEMSLEKPDPWAFYRGNFSGFAEVAYGLDVRRGLTERMLLDVVLPDEDERREVADLVVVTGHAGAGKTVLLYRVAWEAAVDLEKCCAFALRPALLSYDDIKELQGLSGKRLFLFLDRASQCSETIESILQRARRDQMPITLIAAERVNEWITNPECIRLAKSVSQTFSVEYLSEREISDLVDLLGDHDCLGYMAHLGHDERRDALKYIAGRQLLVALHEATAGRPFEDIVYDEYCTIPSPRARALYLTVCVLNRLGTPVRAGLISRLHGIPIGEFQERFFRPLDRVVYTMEHAGIRDFVYEARHPRVAELVYERALADSEERFDEYVRILRGLDVDYSTDRDSLVLLMKGRQVRNEFPDVAMARQLYDIAAEVAPGEAALFQQRAIYEMTSPGGDLARAERYLEEASTLQPHNGAIQHSRAELLRRLAQECDSKEKKAHYRNRAIGICRGLIGDQQWTPDPYPYHTLLQLELEILVEDMADLSERDIRSRIGAIERNLHVAMQEFPDDSRFRAFESDVAGLLGDEQKAEQALRRGFDGNPRNPYLAASLAKLLREQGDEAGAEEILRRALEFNAGEKRLNYQMGMLIHDTRPAALDDMAHYFRRAFTRGDTNYQAQFMYAVTLFKRDDRRDAEEVFASLRLANADPTTKRKARDLLEHDGKPIRYRGIVSKADDRYCFIECANFSADLYANLESSPTSVTAELRRGDTVTFSVAFNYYGPIAVQLGL